MLVESETYPKLRRKYGSQPGDVPPEYRLYAAIVESFLILSWIVLVRMDGEGRCTRISPVIAAAPFQIGAFMIFV